MAKAHRRRGEGRPADGGLLLSYLISTQPQPLQISTTSTPAVGTIGIYVSEPATIAYCNQIIVAVQVGSDQGCLYAQTPTGAVNSGKWSQTSLEIVDGRTMGLAAGDWAKFTFDLKDNADDRITYNLVFSLTGAVNNAVGDCTIAIQEQSSNTNDPPNFETNQGTFTVTLALPQFYLTNFVATQTGSPTVPCTQFTNGTAINLLWESNGTWFQVYKKGDTAPFYAGAATTCTLSSGVATDTTFFLVASMTGNPSQDQPSGGYQAIYLYDALTVTITNPDLTPKTVGTTGNVTVGANLTVTGTAQVTGQSTLGSVGASGLNVTGTTTLAGATVNGPLTVNNGTTTLATAMINAGLTVQGGATVRGSLAASGSQVSLISGASSLGSGGSFTAKTDGFCVGQVWSPGSPYNRLCHGWVSASNSDGVSVTAVGGNVAFFDSNWNKWSGSNVNSICLPVRNGSNWSCGIGQDSNNQVNAPAALYWVPVGTAPSGATFERISDATPPELTDVGITKRVVRNKEQFVQDLVRIIARLAERPIPAEIQQELLAVLIQLNSDEYDNITYPARR